MEFQIDVSEEDRTVEQNAKLEAYYAAAKILRAIGYKARVNLYVVTKPTDNPASIELEG